MSFLTNHNNDIAASIMRMLGNSESSYEKKRESTDENTRIGGILKRMESFDPEFIGLAEGFWQNDSKQNDKIFYILVNALEFKLAENFYKNNPCNDLDFALNSKKNAYTSFEKLLETACVRNDWGLVNLILSEEKKVRLLPDFVFERLFLSNKIDVIHKIIKNRLKSGLKDDLVVVHKLLQKIKRGKDLEKHKKADIALWMTYPVLMYSSYPELMYNSYPEPEKKNPTFIFQSVMNNVFALGERLPRELQEVIGAESAIQEKSLEGFPRELIEHHFKFAPTVDSNNIKKVTILASHAFQAKANKPVSIEEKKLCAKLILNCFTKNGASFNAEIKTNIINALSEIPDFTKSHIEEALKKVFG